MRPLSVEIAVEYKSRLRVFRRILADAAGGASLNERAMEAELKEIRKLRLQHKDASVKDALSLNLPIQVLREAPGTLVEEMEAAQTAAVRQKGHSNAMYRWRWPR